MSTRCYILCGKTPRSKDGLCFFFSRDPWMLVPLCFLRRQPVMSYLQIYLYRNSSDRWLLLPRSRVMVCHMLLILQIMLLSSQRRLKPKQHSLLHLQVSPSASQNRHLHISGGGQLKHESVSHVFRAVHGASELLYARMQQKGQGTLINFTWHARLL